MASQLGLYNGALRKLGEVKLASLAETRPGRYFLDDCYSDQVDQCLSAGQWKFALRTAQVDSDTTQEPAFGFQFAFQKPTDLIRLTALSGSDLLQPPLLDVRDEGGYWWANVDPIYIQYVSNDASYGLDLTRWPPLFANYVEFALAFEICEPLTQSDGKGERLQKMMRRALVEAQSIDGQADPPKFTPAGSWTTARAGTYGQRPFNRAP